MRTSRSGWIKGSGQKELVDETENGGVRADTQGERDYGDGGKAGLLEECAEGVADIVHGGGG